MNKLVLIVILILFNVYGFAQKAKTPPLHAQSNIQFTENKNQWSGNISHRAQLDGGALFIEKSGNLTYHLYDKDSYRAKHLGKVVSPNLKFHAYTVDFIGSNKTPSILSDAAATNYSNFYVGKNSSNWASHVMHYKSIKVDNLYNNIDAIYLGGHQSIKYNFIVKPNGNPNEIKIRYNHLKNIKIKNEALHISTSVSESIEQKPYVFQIINGDTVEILSKYVLKDNIVSFKLLQNYDHTKELIIDPLLVFAAQSGSTADNFGMTATYDEFGNLYSGGTAFNIGYPTTFGAYDISYNGNFIDGYTDVVITKYDSAGTFLRYSTYLGGATSSEIVTSLVVDAADNLCLYGATGSNDFPTTIGCFDSTFNGGQFLHYPQNGTLFNNGTDIYVAKFNSFGTNLMASTYLGGSQNDGVNNNINTSSYDSLMFNYGDQFRGEIQVDSNNDIYITSSSKSSDFPMVNSVDNILNGNQDAILVKLNTNLTSIIYSTFIGGDNKDCGNALAIDDSLNVYITGGTCSNNFFTTTGSYKTSYSGGKADGYICKIKYDGSAILYSTFIGTASYDQSYFVQLDNNKDVYIFGQSQGLMPVTPGVYSKVNSRQFIQKFNNQLNTLLASTIIGNSNGQINISPSAFSVDCAGNIYLSGWGGNILAGSSSVFNMPLTPNAIQSTTDGHNFYIMVLGPNMGSLLFGSYFGGSISWEHVDGGTSRFDKKGVIYQSVCAGCGGNDDFPVTAGAWPGTPGDPNHNTDNNNCNNGVFKIDFQLNSAIANISASTLSGCAPLTLTLTNNSTPGHSYLWDFGNNDTTSTINNPIKTFTAVGTYTVNLYVKASICDNLYDTARVFITVHPNPISAFTSTSSLCSNTIATTNNSSGSLGSNPYVWNWGDSSPTSTLTSPAHTYSTNGTFTVALTVTSINGCIAKSTETLSVFNFTTAVSSDSLCNGLSTTLLASGGTSYTWQPSATVSNSLIANPIFNPNTTTIYTVQIDNNSQGYLCSKTLTTQIVVVPLPVSAFTSTSSLCSNTIATTNNSVGNLGVNPYVWDWGDSSPTSTLTSPAHTYSTNGTYTVALNVTSVEGCVAKSTETISVFNFTTAISSSSICSGLSTSLLAQGGTSYTWQPSATVSNSLIANPVFNPTTTTIYTVQIDNNSQGYLCSKTLTTQVLVRPTPVANFTFTPDSCSNNFSFTNLTTPGGTSSNWSFSTSSGAVVPFSINQNASYSFYSPGTYSIQLIAQTSFGCKDTIVKPIIAPVYSVSIDPPQTKCPNELVYFNAYGGTGYSWLPTTGLQNSNSSSVICSATTSTNYSVSITQNSLLGKVCVNTLTTSVTVHPIIHSNFTYTIINCGNNVQFADSSYLNPVSWDWTFSGANTSILQNPSVFYVTPGAHTVSLIATNSFGCKDTSTKVINLAGFPPISINNSTTVCYQDTFQLIATGGVAYSWQPNQYLSNSTISNPLAFPPASTIYTVTIKTLNGTDTCQSSLTTTVNVIPFAYNTNSITVSSDTIMLGESVTVTLNGFPYSGNISVYPVVPMQFTNSALFSITPTKTGEYTVYFTDQNGCRRILKTIYVTIITNICNEDVVYLPTGFTPNNDGANDILYIRSNFVTEVYLTIYDRWGEKLFETNDITKGWDGTFKGKLLDQGVYGYYLTFKCNNGEESFKKGNITLMR